MRVSFLEAISDPILFKPAFSRLTLGQQSILKVIYGLPLNEEEYIHYCMFQESCEIDELGYPTSVTKIHYNPLEYNEITFVSGRRLGKTSAIGSFVLAYEATCGGHREFASKNQEVAFFNISQQLEIAKSNMNFVKDLLQSTAFLEDQTHFFGIEKYLMKDGSVIAPSGPSMKRQRGLAVPAYLADEMGFWSLDAESANPDSEVERALGPTMLQFPHSKKLRLSSPYVRFGVLFDYYNAGTRGRKLPAGSVEYSKYQDSLVVWATTAMSGLKFYTRKDLEKERAKDPYNFEREYLARFVDSVTGFLSAPLVDHAFQSGLGVRERINVNRTTEGYKYHYIAAIDPAFKRDSFGLSIVHKDEDNNVVLDMIKRWTPSVNERLDPNVVMGEIANLVKMYDIKLVYTDQHQFEALDFIAASHGIGLQKTTYDGKGKARIYGSLSQLVNQRKLILLDESINEDAKALRREMLQVERKIRANGSVAIEAPPHLHDDLIQTLALACHYAVSLTAMEIIAKPPPKSFETNHVKEILALERKNRAVGRDYIYD